MYYFIILYDIYNDDITNEDNKPLYKYAYTRTSTREILSGELANDELMVKV